MCTENETAFTLSPQQRLRWGLAARDGARGHVRGTAVIEGPLDRRRLYDAIRAVVARYEILRTRFTERFGVPLQTIADDADFAWSESDSVIDDDDVIPASSQAAVFSAHLSGSARSHRLTLDVPTSCADGVSLELLFREIADRCAGVEPHDAPLQYADLATWLNEMVAAAGQGTEFWRKSLKGVEDRAVLPTERASSAAMSSRSGVARRVVVEGAELARRLANAANVSASSALLGCWATLLARLNEEKQLLVGVTVPGRSYPGLDLAIGPLERQLPLVQDVDANQTIASFLSSVHDRLQESAAWQEYFSGEAGATQDRNGSSRGPHFGFAHHELARAWSIGTLLWNVESLDCAVSPNAVMLWCASSGDDLTCELRYDAARLSRAAAMTLLRQFETVLHELARVPLTTTLRGVELVGREERAELMSFNDTAQTNDPECTVLSMFHEQVQRHPDAIALSIGDDVITYEQLETRANHVANQLIDVGVGPEQVVGVCLDRSVNLIVAFLAIWKAGAAYLPLHNLPEMRLRYLRESSGARFVLSDRNHAHELSAAGFEVLDIDSVVGASDRPVNRRVAGNLAYVLYTSGSTGEPKGVLVEHRSLANYMLWVIREYGLGEQERVLMKTSIAFDASLREWLMPLLQGGTLIILEEGLHRDPPSLIRELRDREATSLHVVPTLLRVLIEEPSFKECRQLRRVFVGGEILDDALVARFQEITGKTLINMYGPTETTVSATSLVMGRHEYGAIGRAVANTRVHVLRPDLSLAAIGEAGEIHIGGIAVARGYLGRPGDTAEKYVPDPFSACGGRLYRTGDRGRHRPDGVLEFLGRKDGQVKVRGYRVELNEIERALQTQRDVLHAAVLLKDRASGDRQLIAYVEMSATACTGTAELDASMRTRLPDYMCPSQYVRLEALPRTHSGKLDRVALAAIETSEARDDRVAPRTEAEAQLAKIWSAVLGLELDRIGVTENFFQIGGDSIIAIQIAARARQVGLRFTPLQLFQYQTIEELAQAVQAETPSLEAAPVKPGERFALTPIQQAYFERRTDNMHHFNQGMLLTVPAYVRVPWLERALAAVYDHHDALHLRFEHTSTGWQQFYVAEALRIEHRDFSDAADPMQAMRQAIDAENASLDVTSGPVFKAVLFHLGEASGKRLLLTAHHLVIDAVSWRILLEDVRDCYQQIENGAEARPSLKTASYRGWSEGLRDYVRTQELGEDLGYWRNVERRITDPVIADDATGENTVALERVHVVKLPESETRALLSDAGRPYKTQLMELFLSALAEAVHRWRGHTAVAVTLEGHGREEILPGVDLTRTVGWFTSLYPVALERPEGESVADRIKRTKEQLRAIPRRGVSYGLLRYLTTNSGLSSNGGLLVNYLGQMDGAIGRDALLPVEAGADSASAGLQRSFDVTLNALVHRGRLQMSWTYSAARFREESINELARHFEASLRELIAHCCSPQAGGFTLSDVTGFGWEAAQLDRVAHAISRAEHHHAT